jgi:hypothetical protein
MFVRFRQTRHRLQVSLVEPHRAAGKVKQEHVASLGSIETPPSVAARAAFWHGVHGRLGKLSNRVGPDDHSKILGMLHAKIPMPTIDEQQGLKRANAESDEQFWSRVHDVHAGSVEDQKGLAATVAAAITQLESGRVESAAKRDAAKDKRERLERGEDVPGGLLDKPVTRENMEKELEKFGGRGFVRNTRNIRMLESWALAMSGNKRLPSFFLRTTIIRPPSAPCCAAMGSAGSKVCTPTSSTRCC